MHEPNYYNELDPYAAQWLRNLINAGHIAPGYVDERSIEDVKPSDLAGYTQCHFFAGIGVWSYALRLAGVADITELWTGSCPCQPFSAAGQGAGFADERHLWPSWHWLIKERRPPVVFGEQVASKDANPWIDLVGADMEAMDYGFHAVPFPASSVGAPHIRDRLYWVAYADHAGPQGRGECGHGGNKCTVGEGGLVGRMAYANQEQWGRRADSQLFAHGAPGRWQQGYGIAESDCQIGRMADTSIQRRDGEHTLLCGVQPRWITQDRFEVAGCGPTNGFWRDADWLACRDGKWRPVEPGTQPLVDGATARVGRLRAYGNAIVAPQAREFIAAAMEFINRE